MRSIAFLFCYNRPDVLRECIKSLFGASMFVPDEVVFIDDCSLDAGVLPVLEDAMERYKHRSDLKLWTKPVNRGFSDSASCAMKYCWETSPDFVYNIESDHVFNKHGLDAVNALLTQTEVGRMAAGVVGYDHPNFYSQYARDVILPTGMRQQLGEDTCNRAVMHQPFDVEAGWLKFKAELVSNTCWTSYLNWNRVRALCDRYPQMVDLLAQAVQPRDNPNYPTSGEYKRQRTVDDGMLSHAVSWGWNKWAVDNGIDRNRFAGWLNIKPSVADNRWQGGMHG